MSDKRDEKRKVQVLVKERTDRLPFIKFKDAELAVAGQSMMRTDDPLKVTGKLAFGADYSQEGFLHGKILRSPHPHALIKSIDTTKAQALEGVVAVLTAKDVPGRNGFGAIIPDQPVICGDKVRYVGDGVALVAAETEKIAHEALAMIEVNYEPLPAVYDPREAIKEDAPKIHERGNLLSYDKLRKGDVDKGFQEADVILERTYQVPFLEHAYMEPDVAMAIPKPDGTMLVEGPMQAPFTVRRNVAPVLGLAINQVRCRQIHMGGGFGGKEDSPIDLGCRAAVLAQHTGHACAYCLGARGGHCPDVQAPPYDHGGQNRGQERWHPGGLPGSDLRRTGSLCISGPQDSSRGWLPCAFHGHDGRDPTLFLTSKWTPIFAIPTILMAGPCAVLVLLRCTSPMNRS